MSWVDAVIAAGVVLAVANLVRAERRYRAVAKVEREYAAWKEALLQEQAIMCLPQSDPRYQNWAISQGVPEAFFTVPYKFSDGENA